MATLGDALRLAETTGLPWQVDDAKPKAKHALKAGHRVRTLDPFAVAAIRLLIVTKRAGLEGLRIHDLRHSFASVGAGASMGLPIIGKPLGHANATTTARYAHLDADPMRRAVETIGAMDGGKSGEVVPLHMAKPAS